MTGSLSAATRLNALVIAIAAGLLVAGETGVVAMGIFVPLEWMLGFSAAMLPVEAAISIILALYCGYRIARNAYTVEMDIARQSASGEDRAVTD